MKLTVILALIATTQAVAEQTEGCVKNKAQIKTEDPSSQKCHDDCMICKGQTDGAAECLKKTNCYECKTGVVNKWLHPSTGADKEIGECKATEYVAPSSSSGSGSGSASITVPDCKTCDAATPVKQRIVTTTGKAAAVTLCTCTTQDLCDKAMATAKAAKEVEGTTREFYCNAKALATSVTAVIAIAFSM